MEILIRNIIFLLYLDFHYIFVTTSDLNKQPLWTWECVNEKCVPEKATPTVKLQTLETCNMLCTSIPLWPQPTGQVSLATTAVPVRADLFHLAKTTAPSRIVRKYIRDAFNIFRQDLLNLESTVRGFEEWRNVLVRISVTENGDPRMRLATNESYEFILTPTDNSVFTLELNITAPSFCGARHALETLSQLVWLDRYAGSLLILQAATVKDAPKFRYRGLLIDTAHSYFPVSALLRTIDAMAASKLNTLHWHVSDAQGFSLQLTSIPQLSTYGAYSTRYVYSTDQIRSLSRRARLRGIRIIIEIDIPAHVGMAWTWGPTAELGDLVNCIKSEPWSSYCSMPPCGQLNPANHHVFEILQRVYSEIMQLTGVDDLFHLGGSDISERCWAEQFKDTDPAKLWINFTKSALRSLDSVNSNNVSSLKLFWTSRLSERLKTDFKHYVRSIGLQTRSAEWAKKYVSGLRTVLSHEDSWDLNNGQGEWYEENGGAPFVPWQRVYEHRPWVKGSMGVVEGGEATVWSWSLVAGELDARIWPRAAALAERLWTDRPEGATRPVHARLDVHRSRLIQKGIQAAPMWSNWCTQNTYTCN